MSRYDNDLRVVYEGDGYTVTGADNCTYRVLNMGALGWGIYYGPNLDLLPVAGGGFAINITDGDKAIAALIGDPVTAAAA